MRELTVILAPPTLTMEAANKFLTTHCDSPNLALKLVLGGGVANNVKLHTGLFRDFFILNQVGLAKHKLKFTVQKLRTLRTIKKFNIIKAWRLGSLILSCCFFGSRA